MNRAQLEHVIRAAASIAEDDEIYVFGSQSILGAYPNPPGELTVSMETDVAPKNKPELEALIEGSIGELSPFHVTFGYYADGVEASGLALPEGWETRVIVIQNENTRLAKGLCLEPHDCAVSKLFAGREKDISFVSAMLKHRLIDREVVRRRIPTVRKWRELTPQVEETLERIG
jgi:hypothetical protein